MFLAWTLWSNAAFYTDDNHEFFKLISADIEIDFATDTEDEQRRRA